MSKEFINQLFLQEKPVMALLIIWSSQKTYASVIKKKINSTFAHTTKILSNMEKLGLVKFTTEGRVKYIELTQYGINVVEALQNLIIELNSNLSNGFMLKYNTIQSHDFIYINDSDHEILSKLTRIDEIIHSIHLSLIDSTADRETIIRRLGPFKRDLKKIENAILGCSSINESTVNYFNQTNDFLESLINN